jgi:hypothetical protein
MEREAFGVQKYRCMDMETQDKDGRKYRCIDIETQDKDGRKYCCGCRQNEIYPKMF